MNQQELEILTPEQIAILLRKRMGWRPDPASFCPECGRRTISTGKQYIEERTGICVNNHRWNIDKIPDDRELRLGRDWSPATSWGDLGIVIEWKEKLGQILKIGKAGQPGPPWTRLVSFGRSKSVNLGHNINRDNPLTPRHVAMAALIGD